MSSEFLKHRQTLHRYPTDFLLGDLLVRAGIIRQSDLDEAIKLAGNKQVQVGQMLIMARHLTQAQLQVALDAQSALRDRHVEMNAAIKAVKFACRSGLPFSEAVRTQEVTASRLTPTNKLGELLLESAIISPDDFAKALQRSQATGLPLGRILVLNGSIGESLLITALELQVRVRDEMITRAEAAQCLRSAANLDTDGGTVEQSNQVSAALKRQKKRGLKLGELLVLAGILAESDVINALELGLVNDLPMGQILINQGFINDELLQSALKLQELVDQQSLTPEKAAESLNKIHTTGLSLTDALDSVGETLAESGQSPFNFRDLLSLAHIAGDDEITTAFQAALDTPTILTEVLVATGILDARVGKAVLKCHSMMTENLLSQEDATVALDYCLQKLAEGSAEAFTFETALIELGWTFTPELAETLAQGQTEAVVEEDDTFQSVAEISDAPVQPDNRDQIISAANDWEEETAQPEAEASDQMPATDFASASEDSEQVDPQSEDRAASERVFDFSVNTKQSTIEPSEIEAESTVVTTNDSNPVVAMSATTNGAKDRPKLSDTSHNLQAISEILDIKVSTEEVQQEKAKRPMSLKSLLSGENEALPASDHPDKSQNQAATKPAAAASPVKAKPQTTANSLPVDATLKALAQQGQSTSQAAPKATTENTKPISRSQALIDSMAPETGMKIGESYARLAKSYYDHGNYFEAEVLYAKVLQLREKAIGEEDASLVSDLNNLANCLCQQGKLEDAKRHISRAIKISDADPANENMELADSLNNLARIYFQEENYDECEPLLLRAILVRTQILGSEHPVIADSLRDYAKLLRMTNRPEESEALYTKAKSILNKAVKGNTL